MKRNKLNDMQKSQTIKAVGGEGGAQLNDSSNCSQYFGRVQYFLVTIQGGMYPEDEHDGNNHLDAIHSKLKFL